MSLLDLALEELLQDVEQDHWLVALALTGADAPLPHDAELAALVETIRADRGNTWSELTELHPAAVERHIAWAAAQPAAPSEGVHVTIDLSSVDAPVAA